MKDATNTTETKHMPIKDDDARRKYNREYARLRRAGLTGSQRVKPSVALMQDEDLRLETVRDYLDVINRVIVDVRNDEYSNTIQKARAVGFLINIALKALELSSIEERLSALEESVIKETWG